MRGAQPRFKTMNFIQTYKEIPTKTEIAKFADEFIDIPNLTLTEKFINIKFAEELIEQIKKKLNPLAKKDFAEMFNGETKQEFMGVTVQLVWMGKSKALKDPSYEYSNNVTRIEQELSQAESNIKYLKDKLKLEKTAEINNGTAKKLDEMFEEPKEAIDDFMIKVSLRK